MALDRFAAYILAKILKISPVLESKMAQKMDSEMCQKCIFCPP